MWSEGIIYVKTTKNLEKIKEVSQWWPLIKLNFIYFILRIQLFYLIISKDTYSRVNKMTIPYAVDRWVYSSFGSNIEIQIWRTNIFPTFFVQCNVKQDITFPILQRKMSRNCCVLYGKSWKIFTAKTV